MSRRWLRCPRLARLRRGWLTRAGEPASGDKTCPSCCCVRALVSPMGTRVARVSTTGMPPADRSSSLRAREPAVLARCPAGRQFLASLPQDLTHRCRTLGGCDAPLPDARWLSGVSACAAGGNRDRSAEGILAVGARGDLRGPSGLLCSLQIAMVVTCFVTPIFKNLKILKI